MAWLKNPFSRRGTGSHVPRASAPDERNQSAVRTPTSATQDLSSDHAVTSEDKDRFQRYPFARRVAQTIIHRQAQECIVFGIYGAWGEGKTSVINFIQTEMAENDQMMTLTFNPWRYSGEEDLLRQFFEKIAATLKKELKTKAEIAGKLMGKYGKFLKIDLPFIGNIGEKVEGIGEVLGETDVENVKNRVGSIIKENGKKLVIFIDDIDRLDKTEIHSIFRLVKLTADFPNLVYVLAFDEQMVAAAIGERFGTGNEEAGRQFLEKIIQLPLRIPPATGEALEDFCLSQVKASIAASQMNLTVADHQRLSRLLGITLLPIISTPRLAVRYANSLSFALPLLREEVDIVDLIFLEGIKILYPAYYSALTENIDLFMGGIQHPFDDTDELKRNQLMLLIETLGEDLSRIERRGIETLLKDLFPRAKRLMDNALSQPPPAVTGNKRIHDPLYFSRYFTYTIRKGDLSDKMFQELINLLQQPGEIQLVSAMEQLIGQSSPRQMASALRRKTGDLSIEQLQRFAIVCAKHADWFETQGIDAFISPETDPLVQVAIFVADVVINIESLESRRVFGGRLIDEAVTIAFAVELHGHMQAQETVKDGIFSAEDCAFFTDRLVHKAIKRAGDQPFWEPLMRDAGFIIHSWNETAPAQLREYVQQQIAAHPASTLTLIEAILPTQYSSMHPQDTYRGNLKIGSYALLTSLVEEERIISQVQQTYSTEDLLNGPNYNDKEGPFQTPLNIAQQVLQWHNLGQTFDDRVSNPD